MSLIEAMTGLSLLHRRGILEFHPFTTIGVTGTPILAGETGHYVYGVIHRQTKQFARLGSWKLFSPLSNINADNDSYNSSGFGRRDRLQPTCYRYVSWSNNA